MSYALIPWNGDPLDYFSTVEKTEGHYVYIKGQKLLDYTHSVAFTLGYSNQEIIDGIADELRNISRAQIPRGHTTDSIEEVSTWLCETGNWAGYGWSVTGTGAVECAIHMNDVYWKQMGKPSKRKIISFPYVWHGSSYLTRAMGLPHRYTWNSDRLEHIVLPEWRLVEDREAAEAKKIQELLELIQRDPDSIGCIVFDPVPWFQTTQFSENWWKTIRQICDDYDILMIVDDVATGFGKLGAIHSHTVAGGGVQADISALGKSITAGMAPLSATVCNQKVKDVVGKHFEYGHTYCPYMGGIGAMKALKRIFERDKILERVPTVNGWLNKMGNKFIEKGLIRSYRTAGVMMAMDLTENFQAKRQTQFGLSGKVQTIPNLYICAPLNADEEYMDEITTKFSNIFSS